jgi:hypothetical protein
MARVRAPSEPFATPRGGLTPLPWVRRFGALKSQGKRVRPGIERSERPACAWPRYLRQPNDSRFNNYIAGFPTPWLLTLAASSLGSALSDSLLSLCLCVRICSQKPKNALTNGPNGAALNVINCTETVPTPEEMSMANRRGEESTGERTLPGTQSASGD